MRLFDRVCSHCGRQIRESIRAGGTPIELITTHHFKVRQINGKPTALRSGTAYIEHQLVCVGSQVLADLQGEEHVRSETRPDTT